MSELDDRRYVWRPAATDEEYVLDSFQSPHRPLPCFITDPRGIVSDANLDACLMVDVGRGFIIGKRLETFVSTKDRPLLSRLLQHISAARQPAVRLRMRTRTGRVQAVRLESTLTPDNPSRVRWLARPLAV